MAVKVVFSVFDFVVGGRRDRERWHDTHTASPCSRNLSPSPPPSHDTCWGRTFLPHAATTSADSFRRFRDGIPENCKRDCGRIQVDTLSLAKQSDAQGMY